ncbi:hypothetical protein MED92_09889 [Oceanospirillum sp. MED92]|uniref:Uncharacterized protein n=1 Tax=Neptuniibacter caesariensis TaxID=207954 RepID=A0A7U8GS12_NEPCE|nr:hypothetical protein MED92_09889 [Oceanospirillum sp. MED92] [Neptuniibacter caesariensis]
MPVINFLFLKEIIFLFLLWALWFMRKSHFAKQNDIPFNVFIIYLNIS